MIATRRSAPMLAAIALLAPTVAPAAAESPAGVWLTEGGEARIRTEMCGPAAVNLCGYIVWTRTKVDRDGLPSIDRNNPDPRKRARPLLGHQLILGLEPTDGGHFEGRLYNADDGRVYDVEVWSDDVDALTVKGCVMGVFCSGQTWARVDDVAQGQLTGPADAPDGPRADPEWAAPPAQ